MSNVLKILPVKKLKQEKGKRYINKILPQPPFLACLCAGVASGKSNLLMNLLYQKAMYREYFDIIYWFSPSIYNDETTRFVQEDENILIISEDLENIDEYLKGIIEHQTETNNEEKTLLILDDCLGYLRTNGLSKLGAKFRHYNLSCFITVQNFKSLPPVIRYNTQYWFIWKLNNTKMYRAIEEELISVFPEFNKYYKEATKKKYSFLYCDMKKGLMYQNFDKLLFNSHSEK